MRITLCSALACLLTFSVNAQIGTKAKTSLTGIWYNSDFGYQMTLMLNPDGTGEFDGETMRYKTTGNTLQLNIAGATTSYNYELQGNSLNLSGGDLDAPITFTRNTKSNESISPVPPQPPADPIDPIAAVPAQKTKLAGVWSGNGETIEFKDNGQCIYLGNTFAYRATADQITLTTNQGPVMFGYAIAGNNLTLSGSGGQVVYTRGAGNNSGAPGNSTGKGNVAMELVGKWCYVNVTSTNSGGSSSSRCITLNGDGTYYYASEGSMSVNTDAFYGGTSSQSSDQGTWYVQGDRIYYNSVNSGQGSYRLEKRNHPKNVNDPMIVLDGEAYVTAAYRQPWR